MKVLLTHGYFLEEDEVEKKIMRPYPPLGILYISAFLEQKNVPHTVFDTTFSSENQWFKHVEEEGPDLIAFYVNLMTKVKILRLIKKIKLNQSFSKTQIVLGGPDITYNTENYLAAGADYLIIGEGEQSLHDLIKGLSNKTPLKNIDGLVFKEGKEMIKNPSRSKIKDIDELPIPNRHLFPIEKYLETWKQAHGQSALNISTQRGCPYTCKWCSTAVYGQSYRRRSPKKVVEELALLKEQYNPDTFWFVDDVFTVSHKWIRGFAEELKKANLTIKFECITRAERLNDEMIQLLKESGCIRIWIGAESGSQKIIDAMDRRVDIELVKQQLITVKKAGIQTGTFIMVGYPGETYEDILETTTYLEDSLPDQFTITKSYPIKGTSLYTEIEDRITKQPNWFESTDRDIDFERTYPDEFYEAAIRFIYNSVRLKQGKGNPLDRIKTKAKVKLSQATMKRIVKTSNK